MGEVRLSEKGELIIPPLSAEDVPAEAAALRDELSELLPLTPIASLLVELDRRTGFLDCLTHAGGKQSRTPELKRNLLAVLIANATNLGLVRMAEACGISYDILAWTQEWYIREETLAAANAAIVNYHHRLPMTQVFGGGTLSSSDGQRFPVQGKSITARVMKKYFAGQGLSTYTHVSDQHSTFGTKVIVVTRREAQYVLDEMMGNKTDLPITEHTTDTHGVTLVNFALFDLVGMQLSPRIQDLGKITLYRMDLQRDVGRLWPVAGPLLTQKIMELIEENWDDLLRLAASIKFGHATASLIVGKLSASSRQNTLAVALKEYGALRRTVYVARYLADETYRRKIARQLNKGESLHSLRRDLHYAHQGKIRERFLAGQTEQAWCLTVLTNSVVTWTSEYYGLAIAQMRAEGRAVDDELLAHISPAHSENVNYHGGGRSARRGAAGNSRRASGRSVMPRWSCQLRPRRKTARKSEIDRLVDLEMQVPSRRIWRPFFAGCGESAVLWVPEGTGEEAAGKAAAHSVGHVCTPLEKFEEQAAVGDALSPTRQEGCRGGLSRLVAVGPPDT